MMCIGISLALLIVEVVVRLAGIAPEVVYLHIGRLRLSSNPKIGYEPVPGTRLFEREDPTDKFLYGSINKLGYRDYDHRVQKPKNTMRIVVIGDSISSGLYIDDFRKIFPYRLEKNLNQDGHNVEVINFGVDGYNTHQEIETLKEKGLVYSPDLVLLQFSLNDNWTGRYDGKIMEDLIAKEKDATKVLNLARINPLLGKSALYRTFRYRIVSHSLEEDLSERMNEVVLNNESLDVQRNLEELKKLSKQYNFDVVIVLFPEFSELDPYQERNVQRHADITSIASSADLPIFDLLSTYQECERKFGRINVDYWHPNEIGHQCAADALKEYLITHILLNNLSE